MLWATQCDGCGCRALLLNEEGTLMLSGSSDNTIKLWDLGQQRCVQTLAVHTDSVWTLLASPDFTVVYSGGRDKCVYRSAKLWLLLQNRVLAFISILIRCLFQGRAVGPYGSWVSPINRK